MFSFVVHCLLYALAVLLAAKVVPGLHVRSYGGAVTFAAVLSLLDLVLFKVLLFLTMPLVVVTLGLFLLVIRGFLFWLADRLVDGVKVDSYGAAFLGSLVSGVLNYLITCFVPWT